MQRNAPWERSPRAQAEAVRRGEISTRRPPSYIEVLAKYGTQEDLRGFLDNERKRRERLGDVQFGYAVASGALTLVWVIFLICVVGLQFKAKREGVGSLTAAELIAILTTTTATIAGLWWQVGKHLYPVPTSQRPVTSDFPETH